jgi:hypothetical protein
MFPDGRALWAEARAQKGEMSIWATYTLIFAALPIWWVAIGTLFSQGQLPSWIETFGGTGDLLLIADALTADAAARVVQAMRASVSVTVPVKTQRSILNARLTMLTLCMLNILVTTLLFANVAGHLDERKARVESAQAMLEQTYEHSPGDTAEERRNVDSLLAALRTRPVHSEAVAIASLIAFGVSVVIAISAILSEERRK